MHVVIISREDPPLSLPLWRVRGQIIEIRQEDLRFTVASYAEAAEFALPKNPALVSRGNLMSLQACLVITRDVSGLNLAKEALDLLEDGDTFFRGMMLLLLGDAQNVFGDTTGAIQTFQELLKVARQNGDRFMLVSALTNLAQQLNWQGKRGQSLKFGFLS